MPVICSKKVGSVSSEALSGGFERAEGVPYIYKDLGKRAVQRRSVLGESGGRHYQAVICSKKVGSVSSRALSSGFESTDGVPDIYKDLGKRVVQRRSVLGESGGRH